MRIIHSPPWCRVTDHLSVCAGHRSAARRCIACQYRSVWAAGCALRCAPMAAGRLRHLIGEAALVGWSMAQVGGLSTADLNVLDLPGIILCNDIAAALAEAV